MAKFRQPPEDASSDDRSGDFGLTFSDLPQDISDDEKLEDARRRAVLDQVAAGVLLFDRDNRILYANAKAQEWVTVAEPAAREDLFFYEDGSSMPVEARPVSRTFATGEPLRNFVLGVKAPRHRAITWLMCNTARYLDANGTLAFVLGSFTDVTDLKEAQRRLHISEERLRLVLQASNDAPWDLNLLTGESYFSPRWWQIMGREGAESTNFSDWFRFIHIEDRDRVISHHECSITEGHHTYEVEFRMQHANDYYVPVLARAYILRDESGHAIRVSGTNSDISERKRAEEKIYRLGFFDRLTEIPNRQLLLERLQQALRRSGRAGRYGSLLRIDLDNFKILNDFRGHEVGDLLLKEIARRLGGCVSGADTIARLGGDEFVVIIEDLSSDLPDAALAAERVGKFILESIRQPCVLGEFRHETSASLGVAFFLGDQISVDDLLKHADLAMYEAKRTGKNRLRFYDNAMQVAITRRVGIEAELRQAISNNQFVLWYQPQVQFPDQVVGVEALLRWAHPERGTMPPGSFIEIAEETGLILSIGEWVLKEACSTLARWSNVPGLSHLAMSVNVSIRQFQEVDFSERTLAIVSETGADPQKLRLEITESLLVADMEDVIRKMSKLSVVGISFSLDDFGTGYSSLFYLQKMPLAELKIDRSFVNELITNENHRAIARAIITLAHSLNLHVIAEGVEQGDQRDFLYQEGCNSYQGFLFSRPMSRADFELHMRAVQGSRTEEN